jgi:MSHA biogenesis protein MshG
MGSFRYEAIDKNGRSVKGGRQAEIVAEVEKWLLSQQLTPLAITKSADGLDEEGEEKVSFFIRMQGVGLDDLIVFSRQVATLLNAGVDMLRSLSILAGQVRNPILRQTLLRIRTSVEQGGSLSDSFVKFPRIFSLIYRNVIKVGEETGNLDQGFAYMADLLENEKVIKERIKAATRYPKIVITVLFGAIFFLMSFVVPKFMVLFENAHVELPMATRLLIAISNFFVNYNLLIILGLAGLFILYRICLQYAEFVLNRDRLLLKLPIFGALSVKIFMARFTRVFAVLTASGIDIINTLHLSAAALENMVLQNYLKEVIVQVEDGVGLDDAMGSRDMFPDMVVQMVSVGVESGQLDTMMNKVADFYDQETEYTIRNLSTLIEPILLVFMGVIVGFIALAIFTPMWSMMEVVKGG